MSYISTCFCIWILCQGPMLWYVALPFDYWILICIWIYDMFSYVILCVVYLVINGDYAEFLVAPFVCFYLCLSGVLLSSQSSYGDCSLCTSHSLREDHYKVGIRAYVNRSYSCIIWVCCRILFVTCVLQLNLHARGYKHPLLHQSLSQSLYLILQCKMSFLDFFQITF